MAKAITKDGEENCIFLGAEEPKERGALGVYNAILRACSATLGENIEDENALLNQSKKVFRRASSVVTDGASVNTGEKNGLWALVDRDFNLPLGDELRTPMFKIWCAAHRLQLVWKAVANSIKEVSHLIPQLLSISTFFLASSIRTHELTDAANAEGCCVLSLPRVFDVRWTEFTSSLMEVVLRSWRALVVFFKKSNEKEAAGYLSFLTKKSSLDLLTFLADLLTVFSRYQRQLQSDSVTLINMDRCTSNVKAKVLGLKETALPGGQVEALSEQVSEEEDESISLKGVELSRSARRRDYLHLYVTDTRDTDAIKNEVIESLSEFLSQRFVSQEDDISLMKPFVNLQQSADLKKIHKQFFEDLELQELSMEFHDVLDMEDIEDFRKLPLRERFQRFARSDELPNLKIAFARILAAKLHSADVERLISCSVALKWSFSNAS